MLVKLSRIKVHSFGVHCLCTLKDFIIAGQEMANKIKPYLLKEMIDGFHGQPFE